MGEDDVTRGSTTADTPLPPPPPRRHHAQTLFIMFTSLLFSVHYGEFFPGMNREERQNPLLLLTKCISLCYKRLFPSVASYECKQQQTIRSFRKDHWVLIELLFSIPLSHERLMQKFPLFFIPLALSKNTSYFDSSQMSQLHILFSFFNFLRNGFSLLFITENC